MSSTGVSLLAQDSYRTPAEMRASPSLRSAAITGRNADGTPMESAIAFVDDTRTGFRYRGIVLRADGGTVDDGLIALHATNDGNLSSQTTAKIELKAARSGNPGSVWIGRKLEVAENAFAGDFVIQGGQQAGRKLSQHGHDWADDINNKPSLSSYIKSGDKVATLDITRLQVAGRNIAIENTGGRQYLFAV